MKLKHALYIVVAILCFCVFSSCGQDVVQKDLLNYINNIKSISHLEKEAITAYQGVAGLNYKNDKEVLATLKSTVIPKYSEFISKLSKIDIKTEEVMNLNKKYIESTKKQLEALNIIADGMEKQDASLINKANLKLNEAKLGIQDYNDKLQALAKEHKIEIKK